MHILPDNGYRVNLASRKVSLLECQIVVYDYETMCHCIYRCNFHDYFSNIYLEKVKDKSFMCTQGCYNQLHYRHNTRLVSCRSRYQANVLLGIRFDILANYTSGIIKWKRKSAFRLKFWNKGFFSLDNRIYLAMLRMFAPYLICSQNVVANIE